MDSGTEKYLSVQLEPGEKSVAHGSGYKLGSSRADDAEKEEGKQMIRMAVPFASPPSFIDRVGGAKTSWISELRSRYGYYCSYRLPSTWRMLGNHPTCVSQAKEQYFML